mgnify:CR=1 FL=1
MDINNLIQSISKYQPTNDNYCSNYKFGFVYHKILSYVIEKEHIPNNNFPIFNNILKELNSFSMRVISRSITLYLNNMYTNTSPEYENFPQFFYQFKKKYTYNSEYFIEFFSIFKQAIVILYNHYSQTIKNYYYILETIYNNKHLIVDKFSISEPEFKITGLSLNEGDHHNNGLGTASFKLNNKRFFIKWRNPVLEINHHLLYEYFKRSVYYDLTSFDLNILIINDTLYIQKEIEVEEITSIEDYFHNAGVFLFITYLISGSDFHYENIISSKNSIITIDSENIFNFKKDFSVLDTALLPSFSIREKTLAAFSNNFDGDLDILNYEYKITKDKIDIVEKVEKKVSNNLNLPIYKGEYQLFYINKDLIIEGFEKSYSFFLQNKLKVISLITKLFTNVSIRVIKKHTYVYSDAIWSSYTPKLLTSLELRREFFYTLNIFDNTEIDFLIAGNIPYMMKNVDINNRYFDKFSIEDKNKQIKFINEAYILENIRQNKTKKSHENSKKNIDINEIIYWSYNNLLSKSFIKDDLITWLEIIEKGNERYKDYEIDYMPDTLYYGKTGVFLFLLKYTKYYSVKNSEIDSLHKQIQSFLNNYLKNITKNPDIQNGIFDGAAGILYLMLEFNKEKGGQEKDIIFLIEFLSNNVRHDLSFDIISGSIGLLKVLLKIYEDDFFSSFKEKILQQIIVVKNNIVKNYHSNSNICGWPSKRKYTSDSIDISLGYSHGIAGFIPVLYKCSKLLKDFNLQCLVNEAIEFLISQNNKHSKNWPCSMQDAKELVNWCHGSPGILLCMIELYNEGYNNIDLKNIIMENIPLLIKTKKESLSLCHGSFGNNYIGLYIAYSLDNRKLYELFSKKILSDFKVHFTKDNINLMNKSFMTGYTGILYIYLKFKELNII